MQMWYNHIHKVEVVGVTHSTHNAKTTTLTQFYSRILGTTNNIAWHFDLANLYEKGQ